MLHLGCSLIPQPKPTSPSFSPTQAAINIALRNVPMMTTSGPPPCELCHSLATSFCIPDAAFLCTACDLSVHSANFLLARHTRTPLCQKCFTPVIAMGPNHQGGGESLYACVGCSSPIKDNKVEPCLADPLPNVGTLPDVEMSTSKWSHKRSREDADPSEDGSEDQKKMGRRIDLTDANGPSDTESCLDNPRTNLNNPRSKRKRNRMPKGTLIDKPSPPSQTKLSSSSRRQRVAVSALEEAKERGVLNKWHAKSSLLSPATVPLAMHLLDRLGWPWLRSADKVSALRMRHMCLASCFWSAARLVETPSTLERACVLLPECINVPRQFLLIAEERLWQLFRWEKEGDEKEEHATSP